MSQCTITSIKFVFSRACISHLGMEGRTRERRRREKGGENPERAREGKNDVRKWEEEELRVMEGGEDG